MINSHHLVSQVLTPALTYINASSLAAVRLLLGTAAAESLLGTYLKQRNGPALGIYQMEPATHKDIWENYLKYRPNLLEKVKALIPPFFASDPTPLLSHSLFYATVFARLHYLRVSEPLPPADNLTALAQYWKAHYNTSKGKGSVEHFIRSYRMCVSDDI